MLGKSLQEKLFLNFDVKEGLGSPVMLSTFFGVYGVRYLSQKFFSISYRNILLCLCKRSFNILCFFLYFIIISTAIYGYNANYRKWFFWELSTRHVAILLWQYDTCLLMYKDIQCQYFIIRFDKSSGSNYRYILIDKLNLFFLTLTASVNLKVPRKNFKKGILIHFRLLAR